MSRLDAYISRYKDIPIFVLRTTRPITLPFAHAHRVIIVHNCTHRVVVTFPFFLLTNTHVGLWQRPRGGGSGRRKKKERGRERTDRSEERQIR